MTKYILLVKWRWRGRLPLRMWPRVPDRFDHDGRQTSGKNVILFDTVEEAQGISAQLFDRSTGEIAYTDVIDVKLKR